MFTVKIFSTIIMRKLLPEYSWVSLESDNIESWCFSHFLQRYLHKLYNNFPSHNGSGEASPFLIQVFAVFLASSCWKIRPLPVRLHVRSKIWCFGGVFWVGGGRYWVQIFWQNSQHQWLKCSLTPWLNLHRVLTVGCRHLSVHTDINLNQKFQFLDSSLHNTCYHWFSVQF